MTENIDPAELRRVQELSNKLIERISRLLNEETTREGGLLHEYCDNKPQTAAVAIATAAVVLAAMSLKAIGSDSLQALRSVGVLFMRVWDHIDAKPTDPKDLN